MRLVSAWCAYLAARVRTRAEQQGGAINVEYALVVGLIAVVCIAAVGYFGFMMKEYLLEAGSKL